MAIFKVDIEKQLESEYWTNRYLVIAEDLDEALSIGSTLSAVERTFHDVSVLFTKYRASDTVVGSDVYVTVPLNQAGLRNIGSQLLTLFNTFRLDMTVGVGRPSRKYYRGCLAEGEVVFNSLSAGLITEFESLTADLLSVALCDPQGTPITGLTVFPRVQMRQLRRGSRRRATPII